MIPPCYHCHYTRHGITRRYTCISTHRLSNTRSDPRVHCGRGRVRHRCGPLSCSSCTYGGVADSGGGCVHGGGNPVPSHQPSCKRKTALKNKVCVRQTENHVITGSTAGRGSCGKAGLSSSRATGQAWGQRRSLQALHLPFQTSSNCTFREFIDHENEVKIQPTGNFQEAF